MLFYILENRLGESELLGLKVTKCSRWNKDENKFRFGANSYSEASLDLARTHTKARQDLVASAWTTVCCNGANQISPRTVFYKDTQSSLYIKLCAT